MGNEQISADLMEHVIKPVVPAKYLDVRLSLILTVDGVRTEVEPSPERITPRLTDLLLMLHVGAPSPLLNLDLPDVLLFSYLMPLVCRILFLSTLTPTEL